MNKGKFRGILSLLLVMSIFLIGCTKENNAEKVYKNQTTNIQNESEELEPSEEKDNNKDTEVTKAKDDSKDDIKTSYDNVGLLLGLSKSDETSKFLAQYKTIWISSIDGKLSYNLKNDMVLVPHGNDFYKIKNYNFIMDKLGDWSEKNKSEYGLYDYEYKFNYNTIGVNKINEKEVPLYTKESMEKQLSSIDWPIGEINEKVTYVGNEYISVIGDSFETGGGTYNSGHYYVKFYKISDFNKQKNPKKLADSVISEKDKQIGDYNKKFNKILNEAKTDDGGIFYLENQKVDWDNIIIGRDNGYWIAQVPVITESEHHGNGSNFSYPREFLSLNNELPENIEANDSLSIELSKIKEVIPKATDAVSSRNGELLAVITNNQVLVFSNNKDLTKPDLTIDIADGESIVSQQWSYKKYVSNWNDIISKAK
ncbi:hypothetical protein SH2C18_47230 [Clostridium sediminicola]|uniref:hypothetical protein n=1 Tax=Clostridium sediminicola TaxID=3114879 RepID=UPI0031F21A73